MGALWRAYRWIVGIALVYMAARLSRSFRKRRPPGTSFEDAEHRGMLVRDPVCGCMLEQTAAVAVPRNDGTLYFCSDSCAERFEGK